MSQILIATIVAFFTGIFASLGLGGGFILIIYLTVFANMSQIGAQGINLIFFIPIALLSILMHHKNKLIDWKHVPICCIFGIVGAVLGTLLALKLNSKTLTTLFALLLIYVGLKEVFHRDNNKKQIKSKD
ncbi:MAG: sulfite exporter TauE/SafE family protein [Clostridiales bacterium]|nr:sulfite exporter TauE/SafE family protein [Clostridiales bacterium]